MDKILILFSHRVIWKKTFYLLAIYSFLFCFVIANFFFFFLQPYLVLGFSLSDISRVTGLCLSFIIIGVFLISTVAGSF